MQNLFDEIPSGKLPDELLTTLLAESSLKIERIVSTGQASPPSFWYDQDWHEWVVLLSGSAILQVERDNLRSSIEESSNNYSSRKEIENVEMVQGSFINLPAHCRHRIEKTSPNEQTVWLAIHYGNNVPSDNT